MRIVIVGAGEVGFHIAKRFAAEGKDVVVVDTHSEALRHVSEQLDVLTVHGSGSSPKILVEAGIAKAQMLLAVTNSDDTNLIACFFGNILAPQARKIVRLKSEEYADYAATLAKDTLRVDLVINPDVEVVESILRLLAAPAAVEINEFADGLIWMTGVRLDQDSPLVGRALSELPELTGDLRVMVAALIRDEKLLIPSGTDRFKNGDHVYFACEKADLGAVLGRFGFRHSPIRNILIVGGGKIGLRLASILEVGGKNVKIVERDPKRCRELATILDRTVVLAGDGTNHELLEEENIQAMDMVIALTGDEETNIISCLLAKRLGARHTLTRINKFAYMPLVKAIGIDQTVSPRLSAINSILRQVRRGKIISAVSIKDEAIEIIEAVALKDSELVGRPLKNLTVRKFALILTVIRDGKVIIPGGDTVIFPMDRILILAASKDVPRVERILAVKVERG
ncbi:MAG: Trk system potassium transporter TrkA [Desulfovibrionaceae bacterium]|nr:Trk system potassium transporter TrkA [Desulfovibrionaceae bacterium]